MRSGKHSVPDFTGEFIIYKKESVQLIFFLQAIDNPDLKVYCCDFSPTAVNLVKEHEDCTER